MEVSIGASRRNTPTPEVLSRGDVMTSDEVAEILSMPKSTIEEWARRGTIPSRKRGRRRLYLRWEILEWLIADDR